MSFDVGAAVGAGLIAGAVMSVLLYMGIAMMPRQMKINLFLMLGTPLRFCLLADIWHRTRYGAGHAPAGEAGANGDSGRLRLELPRHDSDGLFHPASSFRDSGRRSLRSTGLMSLLPMSLAT